MQVTVSTFLLWLFYNKSWTHHTHTWKKQFATKKGDIIVQAANIQQTQHPNSNSTFNKKRIKAESIEQQQFPGYFVMIYIVNCNYLHCELLQNTHHSHFYWRLPQSAKIGSRFTDNDSNWKQQRSATTTAAVHVNKIQSAESIKQQQSSGKFVIIYIVNCNYLHYVNIYIVNIYNPWRN